MKKVFFKTAFTLLELIIAMALFSAILLGIISINVVLNTNNQDYGQRFLVKSSTQVTMNQILANASLALGSDTTVNGYNDIGILIGNADLGVGTDNSNTFCFHQKPASGGDNWVCYTWYGSAVPSSATTGPDQIWSCTMPVVYTSSQRGATNCNGVAGAQFVGSANLVTPNFINSNGQLLFTLTIQDCLNNADSSCNGTSAGVSSHPDVNPEITLIESVIPQFMSTS